MTKSINGKAQSAFRNLGAVALITATIFFVACKQTGGGGNTGGESTPKHVITFSVEGLNGTLKAKADGMAETDKSPINVEQGKTVTFTATANDGYRVKGWTLDGKPITEAGTNTEYKLKVSKPATVKVSFEAIPPTKYTVTLTQTEGGTVTALPEIPADKLMPKDTEITFTAKADDGYKVDKWTVTPAEALQAGGADGSETAKVKITANTTVSVSFTKKTYAVNFSVAGTGGTLKAEGDGITQPATSPITVEHGKEVIFTAKADDGYRVKGWTLDGNAVNGTAETYTLAVTQPATVKVSFELIPQAILTLSPDNFTIKVKAKTADGSAITVEGCNETTLANDTETKLTAKGTKVILKGKITELYCNGDHGDNQSLTSLNVQGLNALQELSCYNNKLTALNVQGLTALQKLYCWSNQLTELNVQGLTALQELWCSDNQLPELNVQGLTALKDIRCYSNQLTELNVQGLTSLKVLECQDNKLTALNVQGCASLQELDCKKNQLTELNVQGLTTLQKLGCWGNQLTELNVQGCTALQGVECSQNQLNAQAMTEILNALPSREAGDNAMAVLYTEFSGEEGNHKDYNTPAELKTAFDGAKKKNWKLKKENASGGLEDL